MQLSKLLSCAASFALAVCSCVPAGLAQEPSLRASDLPLLEPQDWPAGRSQRGLLPTERTLDFEFDAVESAEIQGWLSWLGYELPVDISGTLSGWLWAQRSAEGWLNFSGYRIEGQITAPLLGISEWQIRDGNLRFGFSDNVWYVGSLSGAMQTSTASTVGQVQLCARLPLTDSSPADEPSPPAVEISGTASGIDIASLLAGSGLELNVENAGGAANLRARLPLAELTSPEAWVAQTELTIDAFRVSPLPGWDTTLEAQLERGVWQISGSSVSLNRNRIDLKAGGQLSESLPFEGTLSSNAVAWAPLLGSLMDEASTAGGVLQWSQQLPEAFQLEASFQGDSKGIASATAKLDLLPSQQMSPDATPGKLVVTYGAATKTEALLGVSLEALQFAGGVIEAEATWGDWDQLQAAVPASARMWLRELDFEQLQLTGLVSQNLAELLQDRAGMAGGEVAIYTRQEKPDTPRQWSLDAQLSLTGLRGLGTSLSSLELELGKTFAGEQVDAKLAVNASEITAVGMMELGSLANSPLQHTELGNFEAQGELDQWTLDVANDWVVGERIAVVTSGTFGIQGDFNQASWPQWIHSAEMNLSRLQAEAGDGLVQVRDARLLLTPEVYQISRFTMEVGTGRVAGSARLRRDWTGPMLLNLRMVQVPLEPVMSRLKIGWFADWTGSLSGECRLRKEDASTPIREDWKGEFLMAGRELRHRQLQIDSLQMRGTLAGQRVALHAEGSALAGGFEGQAALPLGSPVDQSAEEAAEALGVQGEWSAIDLRQAASLLASPTRVARLAGVANLSGSGQFDPAGDFSGRVRLQVPYCVWNGRRVAEAFDMELSYAEQRLRVERLDGQLAGGRLQASGSVALQDAAGSIQPKGALQVAVSDLNLQALLVGILPDMAEEFEGRLDYRGRVQLDRRILASGQANLRRAKVYGLPIEEAGGRIRAVIDPGSRSLQFSSHDIHGTALDGRLQGSVNLRGGGSWQIEAAGQLLHGRLDQLAAAAGFGHTVGQGYFSGKVNLASPQVLELNALTGGLEMEFERGNAQTVPILAEIGKYLPLTGLATTSIKYGSLHGRIGGGQLRIQDLLINGSNLWVAATGAIGLADLKLDLELLVQTGGSLEEQAARAGIQRTLLLAAPQAVVITQITDLVRNRSIYFKVRGSASKPVIQPRLTQTLAKALLQSVQRSLLAPVPIDAN